jgi:predicted GNAT superfamily acetyltransferase
VKPSLDGLTFRSLRTAEELAPLPPFEQRVWGGVGELVAVNMLVATISEGGMAIGAFDGPELVGVVYGFATHEPHVLHSHYLAVDPAWRSAGLGAELKQRQRQWCLDHGRTAMRWTYDPLQLANAHLNLRKLGAVGVAYHVDLYGAMGGINGGLPSDRLVVQWQLDDAPQTFTERHTIDVLPVDPDEIAGSGSRAIEARLNLRAAMQPLLDGGWLVVDVDRAERRYVVAR